VTAYDDLSHYSYMPDTIPPGVTALTVGWIGPASACAHEDPTDDFLYALETLVSKHPRARTRGWHACELEHVEGELPYPLTLELAGTTVHLGAAEIRVVDTAGNWLIAPDLIIHYVSAHRYRPPAEFIEAVLAQRVAPE
jgi:hypothetical protein